MIIQLLRRHLAARARASVALEFALISVFFLLPLMAGAIDFVIVLPGQSQLNTALQSLYYFALSNTGSTSTSTAINTTYTGDIIATINSQSLNPISMPATLTINGTSAPNPSLSYVCYTNLATSPTFSAPSTSSTACSGTQTTMTFVNYKVTTTVVLPIPLPGIGRTWTLSATGYVQLH